MSIASEHATKITEAQDKSDWSWESWDIISQLLSETRRDSVWSRKVWCGNYYFHFMTFKDGSHLKTNEGVINHTEILTEDMWKNTMNLYGLDDLDTCD